MIATLATPYSLTPRQIEVESENDPELMTVREYIKNGDWSKCKLARYANVKNELCQLGKLVLRGSRIVIPQSLRPQVLKIAH